jgi:uncharacterized protein YhaN
MTNAGQAADPSGSLADLAAAARPFVALQEKHQMQIDAIERELRKQGLALGTVAAEIEALVAERQAWCSTWAQKVSRIGLKSDASPRVAMAVIENLREAKAHRDEADILRKRIQGIDRDAETFRARVADLVARLAPELGEEPPDRAARIIHTRLTAARNTQSARQSLEQQLQQTRAERDRAQKGVDDATTVLQALCREANCDGPDMLPEVEQRARTRRQLAGERAALEDGLRRLSAGATVASLVEEAAAMEPDRISADLAQLAQDTEALELERAALNQTVGTERAELRHMDGGAAAAGFAEEAEHLLASLEADVEQYARLKMAAAILAQTIEGYREKHQGPLIQRASDLFARMTNGAFLGMRTEYDDRGRPVLVGVRSGRGDQVTVTGLSDGTADQLYLALRLASIEQYLDTSEALPFVADDILLRFDDERSAATLTILAELAARTQVIFFTHHQHMLDLACRTIGTSVLKVHRLASAPYEQPEDAIDIPAGRP